MRICPPRWDLLEYGQFYLSQAEMERRLEERLDEYYKFRAISPVHLRNRRFWMYHRTRLKELGHPLNALKWAGPSCAAMIARDVRQEPNPFDETVLGVSSAEQIDVEQLGIFWILNFRMDITVCSTLLNVPICRSGVCAKARAVLRSVVC